MSPWVVALFVVMLFVGGPLVVGIETASGVLGTFVFVAILVVLERCGLGGGTPVALMSGERQACLTGGDRAPQAP
jgi:hypothetical protein